MHLGATLRLLRVDAGLSLRDLARRIGVSSAYLSRVENGLDAAPTPERIAAIARELDVPLTLLMDVAHRVSPFVAQYLEQVPGAGMLFLEMARRNLSGPQLARVREFLDTEFPVKAAGPEASVPALAPLLAPERMVLRLTCTTLEDALDVAAGRLAAACPGVGAPRLVAEMKRHEEEASSMVGNGVAVPHAFAGNTAPAAAVVTLARPLHAGTPDRVPLRLLVTLVGGEQGRAHLVRLAHVARLSSHGLAERLAEVEHPEQLLARLTELEALR